MGLQYPCNLNPLYPITFYFEQSGLKTTFHKKTFKKKEVKLQYAVKQAVRTERLMQEEAG